MLHLFMSKRHHCVVINNNNNNDRLTAFDPGQSNIHCVVIIIAEISITFYYENSTMDQISYDHKL